MCAMIDPRFYEALGPVTPEDIAKGTEVVWTNQDGQTIGVVHPERQHYTIQDRGLLALVVNALKELDQRVTVLEPGGHVP